MGRGKGELSAVQEGQTPGPRPDRCPRSRKTQKTLLVSTGLESGGGAGYRDRETETEMRERKRKGEGDGCMVGGWGGGREGARNANAAAMARME